MGGSGMAATVVTVEKEALAMVGHSYFQWIRT
jgi:hypothetical protein